MGWRVTDHITIYRDAAWCAEHPNVVRTPGGDLLVLWHQWPHTDIINHHHPLADIRASRSTDEGRTWGAVENVVRNPLGGICDFGTNTLPDGSVFLHASTTELRAADEEPHTLNWRSLHMGKPMWVRSRDDGRTWSAIHRFPPIPDALNEHPAMHSACCRSQIVALPDGRLLLPAKATNNPDGQQPYFGTLRVSKDMGETWTYAGRIAEDPVAHFSEPAGFVTPSGRVLVLYRCHPTRETGSESPDLRLALVASDDGGTTWSPWRQTNIRGCPAHMLGLRDGRIFLTVGTRWTGRCGCSARVLDPEGTDMDTAPELAVRSDSASSDCGYPWAVELAGGNVLVVYYYTAEDGTAGIEGSIVEEV